MKVQVGFIVLLLNSMAFAQVANISSGVWSNSAIWSNNILPVDTTDIILNFDLIIDVSSSCRSLQTHGHNVTINSGVTFNVNGVSVSVSDIDGNLYPTVLIGAQRWMTRNLSVAHYRNGDTIPQVDDPAAWVSLTTGAWCYYENNTEYGIEYGKLYNWYAVNDPRGLAPEGWHVSTDLEWGIMVEFLGYDPPPGMQAGGRLKESGTRHWDPPNTGDNSSGFTGLPGGYRGYDGTFFTKGYMGWWWTTTEINTGSARNWYLDISEYCLQNGENKKFGYSVRCIKN